MRRTAIFDAEDGVTTAYFRWNDNFDTIRSAPSPRQSHTAALSPDGRSIFILGGQKDALNRFSDIYKFDSVARTFTKLKVSGDAPHFARHSSVIINNKIYSFGGYDGHSKFFGTAVLDTDIMSWSYPIVYGNPPIPRTNHASCAIGTKMYILGGNDTIHDRPYLDCGTFPDFFELETETMTWTKLTCENGPSPRSGHLLVSIGKKIYAFGGGLWEDKSKSWKNRFCDMYAFDTEEQKWQVIEQINPPKSAFISLPHWTLDSFIFVFDGNLNCFDTVTNRWHNPLEKISKTGIPV